MKGTFEILAVTALLTQSVSATVVANTNVQLNSPSIYPAYTSDYALTVFQDEAGGDGTTMWFNVSGATLSFVGDNLDEASDWYLTSYGDPFTETTIQSAAFPVFARVVPTGFESHDLTVGYGDFYLGINTGNQNGSWGGPGIPPRNVYGWVHLQNTGGTLTMLENAMSYQGTGIVIGTMQAIPEPMVSSLLVIGLVVVACCRRK